MAITGFGVTELNLIGSSGTPKIESPNNLNLNAVTVAISTNATVGGTATFGGDVDIADTIYHTGDSNTKIRFPANDTITFHTSGDEQFRIDSVGNVGVGSDTPTAKLDVSGDLKISGITTTAAVSWGGHMLPTSNAAYDIGSAELKVRHLFLSDNSLKFVDSSDTEHPLSLDTGKLKFGGGLLLGNTIKADSASGIVTASSFVKSGGTSSQYLMADGTVTTSGGGGGTPEISFTLGANGTSDYTFTGPGLTGAENDPTIYVMRGQTYKFVNGMGAHPFRIQSTKNGSTGTQYDDGVTNNNVSSGTLTWDVQFDAPDTLWYQCTAHANMGGMIKVLEQETQKFANVKHFGAKGDNSTDDTASIQAAIDSLSGATYDGGTVYFPAGIYRISSALSIDSADNSITLKGCSAHFPLGADGSFIRSTSTTANGIEITNSLSISIENLRIDTSVTKTDGIAIDCESSTNIQGITIDQVYITGFCKGINITGYSASAVRNTEIRGQPNSANSTYAILVDKGSDVRVDQIRFQNIIIDAVHSGSSRHDYSSGFLFKNYVNTIWMYDVAVLRCKIGINFDSTLSAGTSTTGAFFRLQNCDVDQNKEDGIYINGGTQIWIENQYMSSNGNNGLRTGTSFGGMMWITNPDARVNGHHGINISGTSAKKIHILNPQCCDNSTTSSATYHGINVASNADDITIQGGQCGGDVFCTTTGATTNSSRTQGYGIYFDSNNHKRIQIRGVDCTDNKTGALNWIVSGDNNTAASYNFIQFIAGYSTGQTTFP